VRAPPGASVTAVTDVVAVTACPGSLGSLAR
jgi:hypothetical protein